MVPLGISPFARPSWKPEPSAAPIVGILKLLVVSVGVPFLLLSTTGPLLQNWYAHLDLGGQILPLRAIECRLAAKVVAILRSPTAQKGFFLPKTGGGAGTRYAPLSLGDTAQPCEGDLPGRKIKTLNWCPLRRAVARF